MTSAAAAQSYIRKQIQTIEEDPALDEGEKTRRKQVCCLCSAGLCSTPHLPQNLLRLSFGITGGESPEAPLQPHSLPSSVSDALEAMVGGGLDDLTLEDIDSTGLSDEPSADVCCEAVCVCVCVCEVLHLAGGGSRWAAGPISYCTEFLAFSAATHTNLSCVPLLYPTGTTVSIWTLWKHVGEWFHLVVPCYSSSPAKAPQSIHGACGWLQGALLSWQAFWSGK